MWGYRLSNIHAGADDLFGVEVVIGGSAGWRTETGDVVQGISLAACMSDRS